MNGYVIFKEFSINERYYYARYDERDEANEIAYRLNKEYANSEMVFRVCPLAEAENWNVQYLPLGLMRN